MKYPCETVRDLIPLYHDNVCSDSSRKIVEEHLEECGLCKSEMEKIDNVTYDNCLQLEREDVVGHHTKTVKRKSLVAGLYTSGILAIPILVCLIVNLATGHALDWFFIVLTSLMVLASLTVVPMIAEERKFLLTLGSFTGSLMLLFFVCCVYTGGDWFWVASISTLFGLTVVFLPYVLVKLLRKGIASRHKALITMTVDTAFLYTVIVVSVLYGGGANHLRTGLLSTTVSVLFAWVLFVIIRYLKVNGLVKAGICVIIGSVFTAMMNDIVAWIIEGTMKTSLASVNLMRWNSDILINANVSMLEIILGCVTGVVLLIFGILRRKK